MAGALGESSWAWLPEMARQTAADRRIWRRFDTRGWKLLGVDGLGRSEGLVVLDELENGGSIGGRLKGLANFGML